MTGYIPPSRRGRCTDCGTEIRLSPTSSKHPRCGACWALARAAKPKPKPEYVEVGCRTCGVVFTQSHRSMVYCSPFCRPKKKNLTSAGANKYGHRHRAIRAAWADAVDTGLIACARCSQPIKAGSPWDLGHADDGVHYNGPEHQACNRGAPKRKAPATTHHLRWERQDCVDCGARCYGVRCRSCHLALLASKPKAEKAGIPPVTLLTNCPCCGVLHSRPAHCSDECAREWSRRVTRDRYRASHGLAWNHNEPTSKWSRSLKNAA